MWVAKVAMATKAHWCAVFIHRHAAQVDSVGFNYIFTISQLKHFAISCTGVTRVLHRVPSFKLLAGYNSQRTHPKMSNRSSLHPRGFVCHHRCKMPPVFLQWSENFFSKNWLDFTAFKKLHQTCRRTMLSTKLRHKFVKVSACDDLSDISKPVANFAVPSLPWQ